MYCINFKTIIINSFNNLKSKDENWDEFEIKPTKKKGKEKEEKKKKRKRDEVSEEEPEFNV